MAIVTVTVAEKPVRVIVSGDAGAWTDLTERGDVRKFYVKPGQSITVSEQEA